MNKLTLLLGIILCLVVVNARYVAEERSETLSDDDGSIRRSHSKPRTRRRRWQANYGYDIPSYINRRDYERDNSDVIHNIYKLLDELATAVRRQSIAPPPQPIYIPYPVPYPFVQSACKPDTAVLGPANKRPTTTDNKPNGNPKTPDVFARFPAMEDTNQNWGFVPEDEPEDDLGDGSRPISFDPISPKQVMQRPSPQVEHGSQQASSLSNQRPSGGSIEKKEISTVKPGMCNAAILSCCFSSDKVQQKQCFANAGCSSMSDDNTSACSSDSIQRALNSFKAAYSPSQ